MTSQSVQNAEVKSESSLSSKMSELYSIVRGKAGRSVEFGIKWGISRIDGFAMGFVMDNFANVSDKKFCIDAIQKQIELFGEAPEIFGFDRGGYSGPNINKAKKLRRCYRKFKIKKVRIQQTECQINSGNDYVRTPRVFGLQSVQSFAVIESAGSFSGIMKSDLRKSNKIYELIHRK